MSTTTTNTVQYAAWFSLPMLFDVVQAWNPSLLAYCIGFDPDVLFTLLYQTMRILHVQARINMIFHLICLLCSNSSIFSKEMAMTNTIYSICCLASILSTIWRCFQCLNIVKANTMTNTISYGWHRSPMLFGVIQAWNPSLPMLVWS